jgi:hypothetical protein
LPLALFLFCSNILWQEHTVNIQWTLHSHGQQGQPPLPWRETAPP